MIARSRRPSPPSQQSRHGAVDFLTGVAVGVVGSILFTLLADYIPFYRTHLEPTFVNGRPTAPSIKITELRAFKGVTASLWAIRQRVVDDGLRPGRISHVEVTPVGVNPAPKLEIVNYDHGEFWPWRARTITFQVLMYETPAVASYSQCMALNVYDDTGELSFTLKWIGFPKSAGPPPSCKNL